MFDQLLKYLATNNRDLISNNIKVYSSYFDCILNIINENNSTLLEKNIFIAQQFLLLINKVANSDLDALRKYLLRWISKIVTVSTSINNKEISHLITLSVNFLDSASALLLVQSDFTFTVDTIVSLLSTIADDPSKHINFNDIKRYLDNQNDLNIPLTHLIENKQISDINVKEMIPICLQNSNTTIILKSLLSASLLQGEDIIPYINKVDDLSVCVSIV